MLSDDAIGQCDCSNTATLEVAVCPKRGMDAEKPIDNEIENEAVRPKRDMVAEEPTDNEIENEAVRPKSDMDAEKSARTRMRQSVPSATMKRQLSINMRQASKKRVQMKEQQ